MRPIIQIFNESKKKGSPWADAAITNFIHHQINIRRKKGIKITPKIGKEIFQYKARNEAEALYLAFDWNCTRQGYTYWFSLQILLLEADNHIKIS